MSIGPYRAGDIPVAGVRIQVERGDAEADLSVFDTVEAELLNPSGVRTDLVAEIDLTDDSVLVSWPPASLFTLEGSYAIIVTLSSFAGYREQAAPVWFPVQVENGWHNIETARAEWPSAPEDANRLFMLLRLARDQILAFAPDLADGALPPHNYRAAQLMQARNIWNASRVDPSGGVGEGDFILRPHPLDWMIKQTLRPKTAVPVIG